ncbi:methyltransferase domain-containing protein [Dactylosporangium darangshiense]|uniref:Methyltransferase domain-containing protein n=1 Tax=Dactylosporangium darangshiense TaxID=579108 RepID=A0ABP8DHM1_9ACTN
MEPDEYIRALAAESLARDDATGWWDTLYAAAGEGVTEIPWDRGGPHALLASWPGPAEPRGSAVVVGAGLGGDAEFLAARGWRTTAFDISPTAIAAAKARFPGSPVQYVAADLFDPPPSIAAGFDLVVESLTVQALPPSYRERAVGAVRALVRPGGTLLVIAAAADEGERSEEGPPWPLTRAEVESFAHQATGLRLVSVEEFREGGSHRWRAQFSA